MKKNFRLITLFLITTFFLFSCNNQNISVDGNNLTTGILAAYFPTYNELLSGIEITESEANQFYNLDKIEEYSIKIAKIENLSGSESSSYEKTAKPGDTVSFEELTPGKYKVYAAALDENKTILSEITVEATVTAGITTPVDVTFAFAGNMTVNLSAKIEDSGSFKSYLPTLDELKESMGDIADADKAKLIEGLKNYKLELKNTESSKTISDVKLPGETVCFETVPAGDYILSVFLLDSASEELNKAEMNLTIIKGAVSSVSIDFLFKGNTELLISSKIEDKGTFFAYLPTLDELKESMGDISEADKEKLLEGFSKYNLSVTSQDSTVSFNQSGLPGQSFTFENIPSGQYTFSVSILNGDDSIISETETNVTITKGAVTSVQVELLFKGSMEITISAETQNYGVFSTYLPTVDEIKENLGNITEADKEKLLEGFTNYKITLSNSDNETPFTKTEEPGKSVIFNNVPVGEYTLSVSLLDTEENVIIKNEIPVSVKKGAVTSIPVKLSFSGDISGNISMGTEVYPVTDFSIHQVTQNGKIYLTWTEPKNQFYDHVELKYHYDYETGSSYNYECITTEDTEVVLDSGITETSVPLPSDLNNSFYCPGTFYITVTTVNKDGSNLSFDTYLTLTNQTIYSISPDSDYVKKIFRSVTRSNGYLNMPIAYISYKMNYPSAEPSFFCIKDFETKEILWRKKLINCSKGGNWQPGIPTSIPVFENILHDEPLKIEFTMDYDGYELEDFYSFPLTVFYVPEITNIDIYTKGERNKFGKKQNGTFFMSTLTEKKENDIGVLHLSGNDLEKLERLSWFDINDYSCIENETETYEVVLEIKDSSNTIISTNRYTVSMETKNLQDLYFEFNVPQIDESYTLNLYTANVYDSESINKKSAATATITIAPPPAISSITIEDGQIDRPDPLNAEVSIFINNFTASLFSHYSFYQDNVLLTDSDYVIKSLEDEKIVLELLNPVEGEHIFSAKCEEDICNKSFYIYSFKNWKNGHILLSDEKTAMSLNEYKTYEGELTPIGIVFFRNNKCLVFSFYQPCLQTSRIPTYENTFGAQFGFDADSLLYTGWKACDKDLLDFFGSFKESYINPSVNYLINRLGLPATARTISNNYYWVPSEKNSSIKYYRSYPGNCVSYYHSSIASNGYLVMFYNEYSPSYLIR